MKNLIKCSVCLLFFLVACNSTKKFVYKEVPNTPAAGFDAQNSDPSAIALADSIMKANGGRYAWDMTHFIKWNFLGKRDLVWDKWGERVRIDFLDKNLHIRVNLKDMTGSVMQDGVLLTQPDSLKKYLKIGKSVWINDSYWLVMPFKLKDSGVKLKSLGKKNNAIGAECDVIELTFKNVGDTPNNKYHLYANPVTHLITQWDYYPKNTDAKPMMSIPNSDYRAYGHIMLSPNRGNGRSLGPLAVYSSMPDSIFTSFNTIDWKGVKY